MSRGSQWPLSGPWRATDWTFTRHVLGQAFLRLPRSVILASPRPTLTPKGTPLLRPFPSPHAPDSSRSTGPHWTSSHVGPWPAPAPATFQIPLKPAPHHGAGMDSGPGPLLAPLTRGARALFLALSLIPVPPCPVGSATLSKEEGPPVPPVWSSTCASQETAHVGGGPRAALAMEPDPKRRPGTFPAYGRPVPSPNDHVVPEILALSMKYFFKDEHFLLKKILARSSRSPLYAFQVLGDFSTLRVLFFLVKEQTLPAAVLTCFLFPANSLPLGVSL